MKKSTSKKLQHVAIICDGNRRWAKQRGWKVFKGHEYAVDHTMDELTDAAIEFNIPYLTFWIFSTENWKRAKIEVDYLMDLFRRIFDEKVEKLHDKDIRVKVIGDRTKLATDIQERIERGEQKTKNNKTLIVTLALNYGGRDEIVRATQQIIADVKKGELQSENLDEEKFALYLDTVDIPDPDLIIRTGGEQRLSGFMSWQHQYAEFYFPELTFPDFGRDALREAIEEYNHRQRRFGGG